MKNKDYSNSREGNNLKLGSICEITMTVDHFYLMN